jgi:vacuolar-type H+-ATPase subunit H
MEQLLDDLENLIQKGIHVPGSGKVLIDAAAVQGILEQMREGFAEEVQYSQRLSAERDRILTDARAQARRIIEDAQAQAYGRFDDQTLVQMARQRAREIQTEAEQRAASLRAETDSYVANQLNGLENRIQRLLREVQAGQRALAQEHPKRTDTA